MIVMIRNQYQELIQINYINLDCNILFQQIASIFFQKIFIVIYNKDMQDSIVLNQFTLQKLKIKINSRLHYQDLTIQKDDIPLQGREQLKPNNITIGFKFTITKALNYCLKRSVQIAKLWIKGTLFSLMLTTKEGQYCFEEMNYYLFAEAYSNKSSDKLDVSILNLNQQINRTEIYLLIRVSRQGTSFDQFEKLEEITLQLGSPLQKFTIRSQISQVMVQALYNSGSLLPSEDKFQNRIKFIDKDYSTPIGVIKSIGQIYSNLNVQNAQVEAIEKMINNLPKYVTTVAQKQSKLFMCHDMKGGYVEDINFQNNLDAKKPFNRYRYFYLEQTEIFNYFSHFNITVPPKSWRVLCNKYHTKCLGTFIIENPVFEQQVLCSKQFALFLVAIARKCRFDGYLINIQVNIKGISEFKKWLEYLSYKIHQFIPNSVIIWYDSILARDGTIKYQNALNQQNFQFYRITDGIFTNYWWEEPLLKQSIKYKNQNKNRVYIGNDCFGRNTYGGGKYDIYKAANKVIEYKNELNIALFAPAYTYEGAGEYNRHLYLQNELSLYKGVRTQRIPIDKWRDIVNKGNGWENKEGWAATSYEVCERTAIIKFPPFQQNVKIKIEFMFNIMTPQADSPYIVMQVLDNSNNILLQNQAHNFNNYKKSPEQQTSKVEQLDIDPEIISNNQISVKIIEMGRSRQKWAGHYGPHFKDQTINVIIYEKQKHWINKIPLNQVVIGDPFHTYFNAGYGDFFHYEGLNRQEGYNYLADFDLPHTHVINHPLQTDFDFNNVFIGGSSLLVKSETIKLLRVIIPEGLDLKKQYQIQVTTKGTSNIDISWKYISKIQEQRIFAAKFNKQEEINGWKKFTFRMVTAVMEVKNDIRSILDIRSQQYPYSLGQIKIFQIKKEKPADVNCVLEICRDFSPTTHYALSITIKSNSYKRLLLQAQEFSAFIYIVEERGYLRNILIPKSQIFTIKIVDPDQSYQNRVVLERTMGSLDIADLIFKGFIQI